MDPSSHLSTRPLSVRWSTTETVLSAGDTDVGLSPASPRCSTVVTNWFPRRSQCPSYSLPPKVPSALKTSVVSPSQEPPSTAHVPTRAPLLTTLRASDAVGAVAKEVARQRSENAHIATVLRPRLEGPQWEAGQKRRGARLSRPRVFGNSQHRLNARR